MYETSSLKKYLDEISQISVLTRAEENTLIPSAQAGNKLAFDTVIRANLRYVVTIANEYRERGMAMMDIIGEGNLGLFRALESFDSSRGIRFITYAKWWIRQSIVYALIYKNHVVRIPQSQLRKLRKMQKANEGQTSWQPVNASGMVEKMNSDSNPMSLLINCLVKQQSLEQPWGDDKRNRLIDFVPNKDSISPDKASDEISLQTDLKLAFGLLKKREVDILRMLFGLRGQRATLGDVAEKYNISRERVRQIKNNALDKLRASVEVRTALLNYLD